MQCGGRLEGRVAPAFDVRARGSRNTSPSSRIPCHARARRASTVAASGRSRRLTGFQFSGVATFVLLGGAQRAAERRNSSTRAPVRHRIVTPSRAGCLRDRSRRCAHRPPNGVSEAPGWYHAVGLGHLHVRIGDDRNGMSWPKLSLIERTPCDVRVVAVDRKAEQLGCRVPQKIAGVAAKALKTVVHTGVESAGCEKRIEPLALVIRERFPAVGGEGLENPAQGLVQGGRRWGAIWSVIGPGAPWRVSVTPR